MLVEHSKLDQTSRAVGEMRNVCLAVSEVRICLGLADCRRRPGIERAFGGGLDSHWSGVRSGCIGTRPVGVCDGRVDSGGFGARSAGKGRAP